MPPQKQIVASTTQSLRCRRRQRCGRTHAPAARRVEDAPLHAGGLPALLPLGRDLSRADAVDDDAHADAARAGALERLGDVGIGAPAKSKM